jgi:DNA polymerase-1
MPTLFLIDGSSQMYRAYHAIRGLTGPDGCSTNAVFGFVTMLRKLLADHQPEYVAAAFDLPGPTFRSDLAEDYKANRPPMPDDLAEQIPFVHRACEALGVPALTSEGFEADDVIGTLAVRAAAEGFDVAIVTGDKDFFQLVGGRIRVFNPRDEGTWFDANGVVEKFGVSPELVVDVLALTGDAVDNVKGVPGIGERGARDLIRQFGSLDAVIAGADAITQKRYREAILANAEDARRSRELVRIRTDVPIDIDIRQLQYRGASRAACFALFSELGFRSLINEFAPAAETSAHDYQLVTTPEALKALVADIRGKGRLGIRIVADAPNPMRAHIVGVAVATEPGHARYVPVAHWTLDAAPNLDLRLALEILEPVLADEHIAKIGHDLKVDTILLARLGMPLKGVAFDTMLASYVLDATRAPHTLESLALEHLSYQALGTEQVLGKGARTSSPSDLPATAFLPYAGERADLALRLADTLHANLRAAGLDQVYRTLELPLVPVLADIEQAGVRIDVPALQSLSTSLERDLEELRTRIFELAGEPFNINSPKQLADILFEKLHLPVLKKTGTTRAASTAVEVLEELALAHDLPRLILEWRGMQKLKGTYVDALPQLVNPETGRVHTSFNQAVATTGRLSSSDPNLQNIPVRTELGRQIRRAFIAEPGCVLVSADYSQIELRVLAHLSGDEALIDAFKRGEDIHERTALAIFGAASPLDPKDRRNKAKMVNYALLYGKTAFTLARDIGVTQQAAQKFIDAYFAGFPGVRRFIDRTLEEARQIGFVKTLFGRQRPVPEITSRNAQVRASAERVAVNMPIQGTAADILKLAMIDVHRAMSSRAASAGGAAARMILTVHDELLFEVPREDASGFAELVRSLMEGAAELVVPLIVDVGIGDNWNDAKS